MGRLAAGRRLTAAFEALEKFPALAESRDRVLRVVGEERTNIGEMVAAVEVPPAAGWKTAYAKVRIRDANDFPLAGVAVALRRDGDLIAGLKVAITGSNSAPLSVPTDALVGGSWNAEAAATLVQLVRKTSNVLKTTVAGVGYRRRVLLALAPRTVDMLWQGD